MTFKQIIASAKKAHQRFIIPELSEKRFMFSPKHSLHVYKRTH